MQDNHVPSTKTELKHPPWEKNAEGKTRRVGVELEMSGLNPHIQFLKPFGFCDYIKVGTMNCQLSGFCFK